MPTGGETAAQLLLRRRREPALHQVQPGTAGGGLVGGVVVEVQVYVEAWVDGRIDPVKEAAELRGAVPAMAGADD